MRCLLSPGSQASWGRLCRCNSLLATFQVKSLRAAGFCGVSWGSVQARDPPRPSLLCTAHLTLWLTSLSTRPILQSRPLGLPPSWDALLLKRPVWHMPWATLPQGSLPHSAILARELKGSSQGSVLPTSLQVSMGGRKHSHVTGRQPRPNVSRAQEDECSQEQSWPDFQAPGRLPPKLHRYRCLSCMGENTAGHTIPQQQG